MKPILVMTKGLPASGKTTWAKKEQDWVQRGVVRVNKDDLRAMLHDGKHSKGNEKLVLYIRDQIIQESIVRGHNVIVDDTNLAPKHEARLRQIADDMDADFTIQDFTDVPLEVCLERNAKRPNPVPPEVIRKMWADYLKPPAPTYDKALPHAVIVDLDGTLAHMNLRSPYEWSRVGEDTIDERVLNVMGHFNDDSWKTPHKIIILSGRDGICRPETEEWLNRHGVSRDALFMREAGDMRKDSIVKREIFDREIQGKYYPYLVLDDRDQVVRMWRDELGLTVWQVADGSF